MGIILIISTGYPTAWYTMQHLASQIIDFLASSTSPVAATVEYLLIIQGGIRTSLFTAPSE